MWQTHCDYDQIVGEAWSRHRGQEGLQGLAHTLSKLQEDLGSWGAREFGDLSRKIKKLKQRIEKLRLQSVGQGPSEEEKGLVKKLREALYQEEVWLKQRSRVLWLRSGDRNTGYFQAQAAQRRHINHISSLNRVDGSVCNSIDDINQEVHSFYQHLYLPQGGC